MPTMCTLRKPIATVKLLMFIRRSKMHKMSAEMTKIASVFMMIIVPVTTFLPLAIIQPAPLRDHAHGVKVS